METATPAPNSEKIAKTKKELEEMLRAGLGDTMAPGEYNILVFRPTAGSPEWDAEIVSKQRVVEDGIKARSGRSSSGFSSNSSSPIKASRHRPNRNYVQLCELAP
jgi:hypothetical protein